MFRKKSNAGPPPASAPAPARGSSAQGSVGSQSETDLDVPLGASFWDINSYKRVIKRMEAGIDSCEIIQTVCSNALILMLRISLLYMNPTRVSLSA